MPEFLEPWELEAVLFIERIHNSTGALPVDNDIIEYLTYTKKFKGINKQSIASLKTNPLFKASMDSRGIVFNEGVGQLRDVTSLTPRQMAAAEVMLNLTDRRSDEKKLRDIGVSTAEYSTWTQNNIFANYMRERSEQLITNSVHEAHMGLLRGVKQGNTASIKLYYELTGRYNPNEENNVNIRMLIGRVLEAIQKHVKDPGTLNSLAVELSQLAIEAGSPVDRSSYLQGTSIRKELS
jgi:hypothetical protein